MSIHDRIIFFYSTMFQTSYIYASSKLKTQLFDYPHDYIGTYTYES